ncbi:DUF1214 domain-containing protein [Rhizobium sp. L1K21]|uniref:DUF1214 domain-containing protein n=1 Tax=Rhizobium sp. L1K21 TaxID=2954933 RepID=UPI0020938329|nr:DUF1214 domain-containing protein [Rhizobium sp. L1K21]MCO6186007.1 DUF1214 domain-containing protein [Rhizobium sp. L1K21]
MRYAFIWAACAIVGALGGGVAAVFYLTLQTGVSGWGHQVNVNGWRSDWLIGTEAADPYTRAWVALYGLFALRRTEAVYFIKAKDEKGERLTEKCDYRLETGPLPGKWWSFTVYDRTGYLPKNDDGHLTFDATNAAASGGSEGPWSTILSSRQPEKDGESWISTRNAGSFDVTMRIYQPDPQFLAEPEQHLIGPKISKLSCQGEAE